jgi:hypothetical protein
MLQRLLCLRRRGTPREARDVNDRIAAQTPTIAIDERSFAMRLHYDPSVTTVQYSDVARLWTGWTNGQKSFFIALPIAAAGATIGAIVSMHDNAPKLPAASSQPTQPPFHKFDKFWRGNVLLATREGPGGPSRSGKPLYGVSNAPGNSSGCSAMRSGQAVRLRPDAPIRLTTSKA